MPTTKKHRASKKPAAQRKNIGTQKTVVPPKQPQKQEPVIAVHDSAVPTKKIQDQFRESHKYIKDHIVDGEPPTEDLDIRNQFVMSHYALDDYVTLDWNHYEEIDKLMKVIRDYAQDRSRRRPLNIIMQAEPGSGKSHFIKCLAHKMSTDGISEVTFNMASFQGVEDFVQPLEAIRNLKVVDKLPLLFLDEFDSDQGNYALLLPLLWDGELM